MISRPLIIFLVILLACAGVVFEFVWPAYQSVSTASASLTVWQQKLASLKEADSRLDSLAQELAEKEVETEKISFALPLGEDRPGLLVQLEALASANGLILESIDFVKPSEEQAIIVQEEGQSTPALTSSQVSGQTNAAKSVRVDLTAAGNNVDSLKNFLVAVENNLRPMELVSLSFDTETAGNLGGFINFSLALKAYYR